MYFRIKPRLREGSCFQFDIVGNINIKIDNVNYDNVPIVYHKKMFFVEKITEESKKIPEDVLLKIEKIINKSFELKKSVQDILEQLKKVNIMKRDDYEN